MASCKTRARMSFLSSSISAGTMCPWLLGGHLKMYHPWPLQTVPVRARVIWEEGFLRNPLCLPFSCRDSRFMEPVALAAHLDEMAVMHESIEEGRNGGRVAKQFGPILERAI